MDILLILGGAIILGLAISKFIIWFMEGNDDV